MSVRLRKWKNEKGQMQQGWYVDVKFRFPDGRVQRVRDASPVNTRRGAEQHERAIRQALLDGTFGKEKDTEARRMPTLGEFAERFLTYSENNNKPSTVASKRTILERHVLPYFGATPLDAIDAAIVEDFKAHLRRKSSAARMRKDSPSRWALKKRYGTGPRPLSNKGVNNVLAVLRRLLSLAYEQGVLAHLPRVKLFKTEKPPFDFLDFEEAERLVASAEPEWRALLLVALRTGLRLGELIGLKWSDVDLQRGQVHVRRTVWRGQEGSPKGGRARCVDLPDSVVVALRSHRHLKGEYVFCEADGRLLTPGRLKAPLARALKRSGISRRDGRIGWHDLRHTYGSHLAMRGVPLKVIQEQMGHATVEMTVRYAHLSPATRRAAVQLLDAPSPAAPSAAERDTEGHMRGT